jgi:gas vesicle structural protein
MTASSVERRGTTRYVTRPSPGSLAEVIDIILDKGLVIDAFVRISLVGIEVLTIDARIVVASVDTYLRFAEAVNRLDLEAKRRPGLPDLLEQTADAGKAKAVTEPAAKAVTEPAAKAVGSAVESALKKAQEKVAGKARGDEDD